MKLKISILLGFLLITTLKTAVASDEEWLADILKKTINYNQFFHTFITQMCVIKRLSLQDKKNFSLINKDYNLVFKTSINLYLEKNIDSLMQYALPITDLIYKNIKNLEKIQYTNNETIDYAIRKKINDYINIPRTIPINWCNLYLKIASRFNCSLIQRRVEKYIEGQLGCSINFPQITKFFKDVVFCSNENSNIFYFNLTNDNIKNIINKLKTKIFFPPYNKEKKLSIIIDGNITIHFNYIKEILFLMHKIFPQKLNQLCIGKKTIIGDVDFVQLKKLFDDNTKIIIPEKMLTEHCIKNTRPVNIFEDMGTKKSKKYYEKCIIWRNNVITYDNQTVSSISLLLQKFDMPTKGFDLLCQANISFEEGFENNKDKHKKIILNHYFKRSNILETLLNNIKNYFSGNEIEEFYQLYEKHMDFRYFFYYFEVLKEEMINQDMLLIDSNAISFFKMIIKAQEKYVKENNGFDPQKSFINYLEKNFKKENNHDIKFKVAPEINNDNVSLKIKWIKKIEDGIEVNESVLKTKHSKNISHEMESKECYDGNALKLDNNKNNVLFLKRL